jgi:hypothetical protein
MLFNTIVRVKPYHSLNNTFLIILNNLIKLSGIADINKIYFLVFNE